MSFPESRSEKFGVEEVEESGKGARMVVVVEGSEELAGLEFMDPRVPTATRLTPSV